MSKGRVNRWVSRKPFTTTVTTPPQAVAHLLGEVTCALRRVENLVVEHREVERQAQADGVGGRQVHQSNVLHKTRGSSKPRIVSKRPMEEMLKTVAALPLSICWTWGNRETELLNSHDIRLGDRADASPQISQPLEGKSTENIEPEPSCICCSRIGATQTTLPQRRTVLLSDSLDTLLRYSRYQIILAVSARLTKTLRKFIACRSALPNSAAPVKSRMRLAVLSLIADCSYDANSHSMPRALIMEGM